VLTAVTALSAKRIRRLPNKLIRMLAANLFYDAQLLSRGP
jgi:hypothetical protein